MFEPDPISCVIVEDNELNRLTLSHFIELTPGLTLTATLPDGVAALHYLQTNSPPDLLLLAIELPHLSGLELIRVLPRPLPPIVLVTSHQTFAVEAFELPAGRAASARPTGPNWCLRVPRGRRRIALARLCRPVCESQRSAGATQF